MQAPKPRFDEGALRKTVAQRRVQVAAAKAKSKHVPSEAAKGAVKSIVPVTQWVTNEVRRKSICSLPQNGTQRDGTHTAGSAGSAGTTSGGLAQSSDLDALAPLPPTSSESSQRPDPFGPGSTQDDRLPSPSKREIPTGPQEKANKLYCLNGMAVAAITFSTFTLGLEIDNAPESMEPKGRAFWLFLESLFIMFFTVEIYVRIKFEQFEWLKTLWNWFDVLVLLLIIVEVWVLSFIRNGQLLQEQNGLQVLSLVQIVRFGRFLRALRLFRVLKFMQNTVMTFWDSLAGLFYVALIMVAGVWVCAIFMTQMVGRTRLQHTDLGGGYTASDRFGSIPRSIWTLFEIMTLELWQTTARPLVEAEPILAFFFCVYIMVFTFGLMNMVVAVIVDYALVQAGRMFEVDVEIMQAEVAGDLKVMNDAFAECDVNDDKIVYKSEFVEAVNNSTGALAECLERLGIPTQDAMTLFDILDSDVSGGIEIAEFLDGCARVLGASDPKWDGLATHAIAVGLAKQFQEFRVDMEQALGFTSSPRSSSQGAVRPTPSAPVLAKRSPWSWGHPDSERKHVLPSKYQEIEGPHLAPEFVTWQQKTVRQLRMNEELLTHLNEELMDEMAQEKAFSERLGNVERKSQSTKNRVPGS
mmetsp:Transcript_18890/g.36384  ORF Transcript_18890/g.36384 Transcript_18890/m.36384 type:complete len:638 (-) Transcript_18890:84-1997(-)